MRLRSGDMVKILIGKDKGKTGAIRKAFPKENTVIVENANIFKKHVKPTSSQPHGGIVEKAMPIKVSNVALICNNCQKASRIGYKILENGEKKRICKSCQKEIQ
jgi:large subunit ribosomal protein L24